MTLCETLCFLWFKFFSHPSERRVFTAMLDRELAKWSLKRFADDDFLISNEELRRATLRSANDRKQPVDLFASDQAEHAAGWTRQNSPVGIFLLADLTGIFEHKHGTRLHLFRNPLVEDVQFANHVFPPVDRCSTRKNPYEAFLTRFT